MALAPTERATGETTIQNFTFSPATNCVAGRTLILIVVVVTLNNFTVSSVTDTPGNTWTVDRQRGGTGGLEVTICSTVQNKAALTTSSVITVNRSGGNTTEYWLEEFPGQYSPGVGADNTGTSGTSLANGTTAATAGQDEFAIVAYAARKSGASATWTWTKDANYTDFTTGAKPGTSQTFSADAGYRLLTVAATQTATYSVNNTTNLWAAAIQTYRGRSVFAQPTNYQDPGLI